MDLYTILKYNSFIIAFVSFIIALFFLVNYKKSGKMMQQLAIYFIIACLTEWIATIVGTILHQNNLFLFHFFAAFEIFILAHFFFDFYEKLATKIQRNRFIYPIFALVIGNSLFLQPLETFNSYGLTLVSVVIIGMSIYSFYLMLENDDAFLYQQELKWLIVTFFLLHCSSLIVLLFSNKVLELSKDTQIIIWVMRSMLILSIKLTQCYQSYKIYSKIKTSGGFKTPDVLTTIAHDR